MIDVTELLEIDDLLCCPLCDNGIQAFEPALVVLAHGAKQLVHEECLYRPTNTADQ